MSNQSGIFGLGKWRFIGEIGKVTHFGQLGIISAQTFFVSHTYSEREKSSFEEKKRLFLSVG